MGTSFGTLLGTTLSRLQRNDRDSIGDGTAICDTCRTPLKWFDTIPVVSYLLLRGRCRHCQATIPRWTLWLELGMGVAFVAGVWLMGQFGWWVD